MFAYCVGRLGLSEDEACRRIEVARLARQYPGIYPRLAAGQLSLSVIVLLKPYLSALTAAELLELVAGSSVERAKELLAERFPRPDVASAIRKLPARPAPRPVLRNDSAMNPGVAPPEGSALDVSESPSTTGMSTRRDTASDSQRLPASALPLSSARGVAQPHNHQPSASARPIVEPLSKARYKIQLTADKELKEKLCLARDLMRHIQPDGDLAPILSRALDLLIEQIMKRRFGARVGRATPPRVDEAAARTQTSNPLNGNDAPAPFAEGHKGTPRPPVAPTTAVAPAAIGTAPVGTAPVGTAAIGTAAIGTAPVGTAPVAPAPSPTEHSPVSIPRATRRDVAERDGLCCTWQGADGTRCNARAWLELDHRYPRARGGDASPGNIRILCRAHNQRAAEHEYGRGHIEDCITRARSKEGAREHRSPQDASPV